MSDVVAALDYLASNPQLSVDVVNMSLGSLELFTGVCDTARAYNTAIKIAVDTLRSQGITVFAAAGNDNSTTQMVSPACVSNVISVASVHLNGVPMSTTNWTINTDIAAPGSNILSSYVGGGTFSLTGTSMAAPHAAGMAALLIHSGEAITPTDIETRLKQSSVLIESEEGITIPRIEFPIIDFDQDTFYDDVEYSSCTALIDVDTDDDGIGDAEEDANANGIIEVDESDPCLFDTDFDGISDGVERGVVEGIVDPDPGDPVLMTDLNIFSPPDLEPLDTTNPISNDTDNDGIADGDEDVNRNGRVDLGETDPGNPDTDNDGLPDGVELGMFALIPDPDVNGPAVGTVKELFSPDERHSNDKRSAKPGLPTAMGFQTASKTAIKMARSMVVSLILIRYSKKVSLPQKPYTWMIRLRISRSPTLITMVLRTLYLVVASRIP